MAKGNYNKLRDSDPINNSESNGATATTIDPNTGLASFTPPKPTFYSWVVLWLIIGIAICN